MPIITDSPTSMELEIYMEITTHIKKKVVKLRFMIIQRNASSQIPPSINIFLNVHQEGSMPLLNKLDKGNHFTTSQ